MTCSSIEGSNIDAVWDMITEYESVSRECGAFGSRRDRQAKDWMHALINEMLKARLKENSRARQLMPELEAKVLAREITPYTAAKQLVDCL